MAFEEAQILTFEVVPNVARIGQDIIGLQIAGFGFQSIEILNIIFRSPEFNFALSPNEFNIDSDDVITVTKTLNISTPGTYSVAFRTVLGEDGFLDGALELRPVLGRLQISPKLARVNVLIPKVTIVVEGFTAAEVERVKFTGPDNTMNIDYRNVPAGLFRKLDENGRGTITLAQVVFNAEGAYNLALYNAIDEIIQLGPTLQNAVQVLPPLGLNMAIDAMQPDSLQPGDNLINGAILGFNFTVDRIDEVVFASSQLDIGDGKVPADVKTFTPAPNTVGPHDVLPVGTFKVISAEIIRLGSRVFAIPGIYGIELRKVTALSGGGTQGKTLAIRSGALTVRDTTSPYPVFTPPPGQYCDQQELVLSAQKSAVNTAADPSSKVYFTIDGTTPQIDDAYLFPPKDLVTNTTLTSITLKRPTVVKAITVDPVGNFSPVVTGFYFVGPVQERIALDTDRHELNYLRAVNTNFVIQQLRIKYTAILNQEDLPGAKTVAPGQAGGKSPLLRDLRRGIVDLLRDRGITLANALSFPIIQYVNERMFRVKPGREIFVNDYRVSRRGEETFGAVEATALPLDTGNYSVVVSPAPNSLSYYDIIFVKTLDIGTVAGLFHLVGTFDVDANKKIVQASIVNNNSDPLRLIVNDWTHPRVTRATNTPRFNIHWREVEIATLNIPYPATVAVPDDPENPRPPGEPEPPPIPFEFPTGDSGTRIDDPDVSSGGVGLTFSGDLAERARLARMLPPTNIEDDPKPNPIDDIARSTGDTPRGPRSSDSPFSFQLVGKGTGVIMKEQPIEGEFRIKCAMLPGLTFTLKRSDLTLTALHPGAGINDHSYRHFAHFIVSGTLGPFPPFNFEVFKATPYRPPSDNFFIGNCKPYPLGVPASLTHSGAVIYTGHFSGGGLSGRRWVVILDTALTYDGTRATLFDHRQAVKTLNIGISPRPLYPVGNMTTFPAPAGYPGFFVYPDRPNMRATVSPLSVPNLAFGPQPATFTLENVEPHSSPALADFTTTNLFLNLLAPHIVHDLKPITLSTGTVVSLVVNPFLSHRGMHFNDLGHTQPVTGEGVPVLRPSALHNLIDTKALKTFKDPKIAWRLIGDAKNLTVNDETITFIGPGTRGENMGPPTGTAAHPLRQITPFTLNFPTIGNLAGTTIVDFYYHNLPRFAEVGLSWSGLVTVATTGIIEEPVVVTLTPPLGGTELPEDVDTKCQVYMGDGRFKLTVPENTRKAYSVRMWNFSKNRLMSEEESGTFQLASEVLVPGKNKVRIHHSLKAEKIGALQDVQLTIAVTKPGSPPIDIAIPLTATDFELKMSDATTYEIIAAPVATIGTQINIRTAFRVDGTAPTLPLAGQFSGYDAGQGVRLIVLPARRVVNVGQVSNIRSPVKIAVEAVNVLKPTEKIVKTFTLTLPEIRGIDGLGARVFVDGEVTDVSPNKPKLSLVNAIVTVNSGTREITVTTPGQQGLGGFPPATPGFVANAAVDDSFIFVDSGGRTRYLRIEQIVSQWTIKVVSLTPLDSNIAYAGGTGQAIAVVTKFQTVNGGRIITTARYQINVSADDRATVQVSAPIYGTPGIQGEATVQSSTALDAPAPALPPVGTPPLLSLFAGRQLFLTFPVAEPVKAIRAGKLRGAELTRTLRAHVRAVDELDQTNVQEALIDVTFGQDVSIRDVDILVGINRVFKKIEDLADTTVNSQPAKKFVATDKDMIDVVAVPRGISGRQAVVRAFTVPLGSGEPTLLPLKEITQFTAQGDPIIDDPSYILGIFSVDKRASTIPLPYTDSPLLSQGLREQGPTPALRFRQELSNGVAALFRVDATNIRNLQNVIEKSVILVAEAPTIVTGITLQHFNSFDPSNYHNLVAGPSPRGIITGNGTVADPWIVPVHPQDQIQIFGLPTLDTTFPTPLAYMQAATTFSPVPLPELSPPKDIRLAFGLKPDNTPQRFNVIPTPAGSGETPQRPPTGRDLITQTGHTDNPGPPTATNKRSRVYQIRIRAEAVTNVGNSQQKDFYMRFDDVS